MRIGLLALAALPATTVMALAAATTLRASAEPTLNPAQMAAATVATPTRAEIELPKLQSAMPQPAELVAKSADTPAAASTPVAASTPATAASTPAAATPKSAPAQPAPSAMPGHGVAPATGLPKSPDQLTGHDAEMHEDAPQGKNETTVDYLWRKSDVAFHLGDYERAVGIHKAIQILDPTDPENYGVTSWLLWSMGRKDEAIQFMDKGLQAAPNDWQMWDEAGQHNDLQKRLPEAEKAYARAVQLVPKTENSQMLRRRYAHAAEKAGDIKVAIEVWRGLVQDFPKEVVNKNNLARVEKLG